MHVERLATGLVANGHEVEVLTQTPRDGGLPEQERLDGVLVRRFSTPVDSQHYAFSPRLAIFLRRNARSYRLVHAHNYHALPALAAAATANRNLVLTPHYHGTSESPARRLLQLPYRLAGRRMFRRARAVISVSPSEADLLSRHFPDAAGKVTVIPNGVDTQEIDTATPFERAGKTVVLSAGRLKDYKRVELTIRAMQHLDRDHVLYVAGDGPARRGLEDLVGELGLSDRVFPLGRIPRADLNRWFKTADVFASMSSIEAMGIAPLEAAYAGAAVVASDIPAHRDSAQLSGGGFTLVDQDATPEQIAAALAAAGSGTPAPAGIESWDRIVARTELTYDEVAA